MDGAWGAALGTRARARSRVAPHEVAERREQHDDCNGTEIQADQQEGRHRQTRRRGTRGETGEEPVERRCAREAGRSQKRPARND